MAQVATVVEHGKHYRVQIRRQGHAPISKSGFRTRVEAKMWARQAEAAIDRDQRVEIGAVTYGAILKAYREATASKTCSRSKRLSLDRLARRFGTIKLSQFTSKALIAYIGEREAEGNAPPTLLQELSYIRTSVAHGTAALDLDCTQALAAIAAARKILAHADRVTKSRERDRRPTDAELLALMSHWRRYPPRELPMANLVLFACATGMRLSEILSLKRCEYDAAKRVIMIRNRKHPKQKIGNDQIVPLLRGPFVLAGQIIDPVEIIQRQGNLPRRSFLITLTASRSHSPSCQEMRDR